MNIKDSINKRFIKAVEKVINDNVAKNKREIADVLEISPSKFSEILKERMNAGLDNIQKFCSHYGVNYYYIFEEKGDFYVNLNVNLNVNLKRKNNTLESGANLRSNQNPNLKQKQYPGPENNPPFVIDESRQKYQTECVICKEKERIISTLESKIENLQQQVQDLRTDKEDCKEMLKAANQKNSEDNASSKRNSA